MLCDTVGTASFLYRECDGREIESTGTVFDLRFIPDDVVFSQEPRCARTRPPAARRPAPLTQDLPASRLPLRSDSATEVPADYTAPAFYTRSLQHTKVELTWDEDGAFAAGPAGCDGRRVTAALGRPEAEGVLQEGAGRR